MLNLSRLEDLFIYFGMPAVTFYHLLCSNVFLNTAAEDAHGLEKMGNFALTPFRYLFAGRSISVDEEGRYEIQQCFHYHDHLFIETTGAILSLPLGLAIGSALKGAAFFSEDVCARHKRIASSLQYVDSSSTHTYYRNIGIDLSTSKEKLVPMGYERKPGDENHLYEEKKAFAEIVRILKEHHIVFWADCGTCLGAYRYGGMIPWDNDLDIAILEPDFLNMYRALEALDPSLYFVEDWSNRNLPNTYARVYIKSTRGYIDIYTYAIDPIQKTVRYICSNENNMFMLESWKINERRYKVETPFDVVFPLRYADFDGCEVPVPHQTERYLQMRYGDNLSPAKIYNAKTQTYDKDLSHPYWQRAYAH